MNNQIPLIEIKDSYRRTPVATNLVQIYREKQAEKTDSKPSSFNPKDTVCVAKETALDRYAKYKEGVPRFLPMMGFGAIGYYNKIKDITIKSVSIFDV